VEVRLLADAMRHHVQTDAVSHADMVAAAQQPRAPLALRWAPAAGASPPASRGCFSLVVRVWGVVAPLSRHHRRF
jgi:hypothetical protein